MTKGKARRGTRHKNRLDRLLNLLGSFLRRNVMIIRSLVIFVGIILAFVLALPLYYGFVKGPFPVAIATATGVLLRVLGVDLRISGQSIISPLFSMEVIPACTGMFAYIFFFAAVVAYPCRVRDRLIGIGLGFPAIFIINLVRLVSLFYIGAYLPQFFDVAHLLFWQSLMIASAVLLWLFWAHRASYAHK